MNSIRYFVILSRPFSLLGAILVYALGIGIARYLGALIDWEIAIFGQVWVIFLQLSTHYLIEYFDYRGDSSTTNRTPISGGSGVLGSGKLPPAVALWASITCLTFATSITVLIMRVRSEPAIFMIMAVIFLGAFFYSVPPVRLVTSGYGELTTSLVVAVLVPTFSFFLQTQELHRLVAMVTFPLSTLYLAMMLAFELPNYASDLKYEKKTLMIRIGWERGMTMHNILILSTYVLLGIGLLLGFPPALALPGFLSLPLGLFQIWNMNRIAGGAPPNWRLLTLGAVSLFGLTAYFFTFAFWIR
jgi:1,4-dihydroxy-2-naphthoate octaprenyltransferase